VGVAVHDMGPLFHIVWWISRKERGILLISRDVEIPPLIAILFRQINIDYSICNALNWNKSRTALVVYDICCQWWIHFWERMSKYKFLSLSEDIEITPAVGKFHLGAHIKECFHKFSLNFIKGSGQLDGEIMETLWSVLDKIAGMTRSMSKYHRQEVLDDYMNDSNWKKIVRIGG